MAKSLLKLVCASLVLAGCGTVPQTASDMRTSTHPLIQKSSVMVPRSSGSVASALERGAKRCLNKTQDQSFTRSTQYGLQTTSITHYYNSALRRSGSGRAELAIYKTTRGAITPGAPDGRHLAYLVDVTPTSGGTKLSIYGGKMGYGDLNSSVTQWAKGGALNCPTLP